MVTIVFFIRETEFAEKPANRIGVCLHPGCISQGASRFGYSYVAVPINRPNQKGAMRIKPALAARPTLRAALA